MGKPIGIYYDRVCKACGTIFRTTAPDAQYCGNTCRNRAYDARRRGEELPEAKPKRKKKTEMDRIVEMNTSARKMGMTYGQYQQYLYKIKGGK